MAKQAKQREKGNKKQRVDKTVHHSQDAVVSGLKPNSTGVSHIVYSMDKFLKSSGISIDEKLVKKQSIALKKQGLKGYVESGGKSYLITERGLIEKDIPGRKSTASNRPAKKLTRQQAIKKELSEAQKVIRRVSSSPAEVKAANKLIKTLHSELNIIRKEQKTKISNSFPEKPIGKDLATFRADIKNAKASEFNRIMREKVRKLRPNERDEIVSKTKAGMLKRNEIRLESRKNANDRVDDILTRKTAPPKGESPEVKRIWGTRRIVPGFGGRTKNIQIVPKKNPAARGPNKETQKTIEKDGFTVVRSIGRKRKAHEAGVPERKAKRAAEIERRRPAVIKKFNERRREYSAGRRAKDPVVLDRTNKENKRLSAIAKKIDKQIDKKGNTKTLTELAERYGIGEKGYRRGKYFSGKEFSGKGGKRIIVTKPLRKTINKPKLGAKYFPKNRFPKVKHASRTPSKPLITEGMKNQIKGNVILEQPRGFHSKMHKQMPRRKNTFDLYKTTKTMDVPSLNPSLAKAGVMRDFKGKGRGVLMAMQLRGLITIDGKEVTNRIINQFTPAIKKGIVSASNVVGRKILDIIEPYVPKDRGYMYQSATVNADQAAGDAMSAGGMMSMADGAAFPESERLGVSFSYNTPYAEMVYFDETKAHGAEYNAKHGVQEKGEKETARWIEVALQKEELRLRSLLGDYALSVTTALNGAGGAGRMGPH